MDTRPKLLIVDDRPENLVALERILAPLGAEIIRATSGNQALALTLEHDFALVLMDVQMPGMDGYETVTLMRQDKKTEFLPVIFLSAVYSGKYYQIKGVEVGAVDFIEKPLNPEVLLGKVRNFLELHRYHRMLKEFNRALEVQVEKRTAELREANLNLKNEMDRREKMERQIRQMQKMEALGILAGGIAHEFNNLLAIIQGNCEFAMGENEENRPALEELTEIGRASERARKLVQQILTYSSKNLRELKLLNLTGMLEELIDTLKTSTPPTIRIETNLNAQKVNLMADPNEIRQIVQNLFTNAYQAIETNGLIRIGLTAQTVKEGADGMPPNLPMGRYAILEISDNGCGMNQEVMEQIFDPFFTTRPVGQGAGLGLSVVQGIVKNNDGAVTVESLENQGTTFRVFLPLIDEEPIEQPAPVQPVVSPKKGGDRVLLVDDEEPLLRLAARILEKQDYQVTACNSPREALKIFDECSGDFDLVITDQAMPELNGFELAEMLREIQANVPIILCSGFNKHQLGDDFQRIGFSGHIVKPYEKKVLITQVEKVLNQGDKS